MNRCSRHLSVIGFALVAVVAACAPRETVLPEQASPSPPTSTAPPTLEPAATPTPTNVFGLVPAELADFIVFPGEPPAWLIDPTADVVTVAMGSFVGCGTVEPYQLIFVNAASGDRFEMIVPAASGMLWLDSHTFGLFWKTADILLTIDFADRSVTATTFAVEGIHRLGGTEPLYDEDEGGCMMNAMVLLPGGPTGMGEPEFAIPRRAYSADLSLLAARNTTGTNLEVWQVGSDVLVWSADPNPEDDDTHEGWFAWSPVAPTLLAVGECEADPTSAGCIWSRLYIVDVARGEEVASFPGQFSGVSWSPDGSRILYISPEWDLRSSNMGFSGPPCVLDVGTGTHECFGEIPAAHFPEDLGIEVRRIYSLRWDQGGEGFYYIYGAAYHPVYLGTPEPRYEHLAGVCHFDLSSGEVSCPSEGVPDLQGSWSDYDYELSPDEGFAYVRAEGASFVHGVLNIQDLRFFRLPDPPVSGCEGYFCFVTALWRPSVGEPPEANSHRDTPRAAHKPSQRARGS